MVLNGDQHVMSSDTNWMPASADAFRMTDGTHPEAHPRPIVATWNRSGLKAAGFDGFVQLRTVNLASVPLGHGVYVVLRPVDLQARFLEKSLGPKLRAYDLDELESRWISQAETVYIGKAGGRRGLRGRLTPFARMAANHSGGRAIWQLSEPEALTVGWLQTPVGSATEIEDLLHAEFWMRHGALPFANIGFSRAARALVGQLRFGERIGPLDL